MNFEDGKKRLEELSLKTATDAQKQLSLLFDDGSFTLLDRFTKNGDNACDLACAYGTVGGVMTLAFSQNKGADGAMGRVLSAKLKKVFELAKKIGAPVIGVYNSSGAHIDEGVEALEAYGDCIAEMAALSGVVPQIAVVTGDCIGSAAVMAAMADIVVMAKDAEMYVTAGSVLKNDKVGSSELAAKNGTAAVVTETAEEALAKAAELVTLLPQNNLSEPYIAEYNPSVGEINGTDAYEVINAVTDNGSFCELYRDYAEKAVVGIARIGGACVGIVATNCDDKKINASAATKIARFVRFCDAFSVPVVTFVDCEGILGNEEDELAGGVKCASQLAHAYAEATTAKVTVITGAAVGEAYIAFASRAAGIDSTFAWSTAYVSALTPDAAVEFLCGDKLADGTSREDARKEYCENEASAFAAAEKGVIEDVINPYETASKLSIALDMLSTKRISTLNKKHSDIQL